MPAAALRASRAAAMHALLEPAPFAVSLPLHGLPATRAARALARAVGGSLRPERGHVVVVEPVEPPGVAREWLVTAATTADGTIRLTSPLLDGAAGLARLQAVVRVLRAEGACAGGSLVVHLDAADLTARGLDAFLALVARQLPVVYAAAGVDAPRPPASLEARVLRRLEAGRRRPAHPAAARWAGAARTCVAEDFSGLALDGLAVTGFVALGLPLVSLHSAEVTALVQIAVGLLHRARTARAVARSERPLRADSLKYDLRVLLLYLGFIGDAFRAQREQLLHRVAGCAAWKARPLVAP